MRYLLIFFTLLCVSCGAALPTIKPYKLDVQQGNVVTSKMLLQLRPGMTKSQVRFIMGTPLVQDSFHGNRWDYVYQMREGGKVTEQRRVILDFESELLKKVRGDVIAAGSEQSKLDNKFDIKSNENEAQTGTRVITPGKKVEEKSLLGKLKFWEKDEAELATANARNETTLKAKTEAEAVAKLASVPEEILPVAEQSQSMLAVPLLDLPAVAMTQNTMPDEIPVAETSIQVATPDAVEAATMQPKPTQSISVSTETATAMLQPEPSSVSLPLVLPESPTAPGPKAPSYEPTSGMLFDRTLRSVSDEAEPAASEVQSVSRAKDNVPPKPKDLPAETSTSFFDRMLEAIGF